MILLWIAGLVPGAAVVIGLIIAEHAGEVSFISEELERYAVGGLLVTALATLWFIVIRIQVWWRHG